MHHRTTLSGYVNTLQLYDNRTKTCLTAISTPQVLTMWWTSGHQRLRSVGEFGSPQQISTDFASWLPYCTDVAQQRSTKLCTIFDSLLCWYTIYIHFWVFLPPNGILPRAKLTLRPSPAFSYIGSITAWHSSSGHQSNCGIQRTVPPIFGRQPCWASAHILVCI